MTVSTTAVECPFCREPTEEEPNKVLDYSTSTPTLFTVWRCTSRKHGETRIFRGEDHAPIPSIAD